MFRLVTSFIPFLLILTGVSGDHVSFGNGIPSYNNAQAIGETERTANKPAQSILPTDPMVIRETSLSSKIDVEQLGCHKFCVGKIICSSPSQSTAWNPFNQSTNQVYYFRNMDIDMSECSWKKAKENSTDHGIFVPELFWEASNYDRLQPVINYDQATANKYGYILSTPAHITEHSKVMSSFSFLVYNPSPSPRYGWTVRWTAYQNICSPGTKPPIKNHYEEDAFNPRTVFKF